MEHSALAKDTCILCIQAKNKPDTKFVETF